MLELILECKLNGIIDTTNKIQAWAATLNIDKSVLSIVLTSWDFRGPKRTG
jgi:hypothetical protein